MDCRIIRTLQELESIKDDWERLEQIAPQVTYFSSYRLNHDWWLSYDDDDSLELFVIAAEHQRHIVGIAPLQIKRSKEYSATIKTLQFIHTGNDYANFIIGDSDSVYPVSIVKALLTHIEEHKYEYDRIDLKHISQHTLLSHVIMTGKHINNYKFLTECAYIDTSNYPNFESYSSIYQPRRMKTEFNRFCREINYSLEVSCDNTIDEIGVIHKAEKDFLQSRGKIGRHSYFENAREVSFKQRLYSNNKNVITYLLSDNENGELICFVTGYLKDDIFHAVTSAYNPKYEVYTVGKFFNFMIVGQNYKTPKWKIIDFGTGRYSWKFGMTETYNILYELYEECIRDRKSKIVYKWRRLLSILWNGAKA